MGWKADCFLFHLVVEYCTNPSSLFFLLLTHSPKVFAQGKGKIVTKKLLIQINVVCHLKLFGRLVRTIVLSKMSKMHLFFKRNGCKMLQTNFLRLTFSFTSLLSNFFQPSFQSFVYWKVRQLGTLHWLLFLIRFLLFSSSLPTRTQFYLHAHLASGFICSFMGDKSW